MMKLIGKKFMKSAMCFSVLCALSTGVSIGSMMADNQPVVESIKLNGNEITLPTVAWQSGQNFGTNIDVKKSTNNRSILAVLGIDIGTQYTEVVKYDSKNIAIKVLEDKLSKKKSNLNFNCPSALTLMAFGDKSVGTFYEPSYHDYIQALTNQKEKDEDYKYFMDVLIRKSAHGYAIAPQGLMLHVKEVSDGRAKYEYDGKIIDLTADQYKKLKNAVQFSYILRALRIYSSYPGIQDFIANSENTKQKPLISLTYNAAIQGYEKDCLVNAVKYVFEAEGDVNKLDEALNTVNTNGTRFDYQILPASVAAQVCYQFENGPSIKKENENKKVIILDYGYNGLSISGAEHRGDGCTIYPDQCFTDCGGKVIDDVLLEYYKKKIVKDKDIRVQDLDANINQFLDAQILKEVESVKEKLSANGATGINVVVDGVLSDDDDYEDQFSVDKLNQLLNDAGIVKNFENAVSNYIIKNHRELGVNLDNNGNVTDDGEGDFEIVITGASLRIPILQKTAISVMSKYSKQKDLTRTLNMDECFAYGTFYAGYSYDVDPLKGFKAEKIPNFEDVSFKEIQNLVNNSRTDHAYSAWKNALESGIFDLESLFGDDLKGVINELPWQGYLKKKELVNYSKVIPAISKKITSMQNTTISQSDIDSVIEELNNSINALPADIKSYDGVDNVKEAYNGLVLALKNYPMHAKINLLNNTIETWRNELSKAKGLIDENKGKLNDLEKYIESLDQSKRNDLIEKANALANCYGIEESLSSNSQVGDIVSFILGLKKNIDFGVYGKITIDIGNQKFQDIIEELQKKYGNDDLEVASKNLLDCFNDNIKGIRGPINRILFNNARMDFYQDLLSEEGALTYLNNEKEELRKRLITDQSASSAMTSEGEYEDENTSSVPAIEVHVPSRGVVEKVIVDYGLKFALGNHVVSLGKEAQQVEDERREEIDDINGQLETFKQKIDELSIDKEQIINKVNELAELSGIKGDKLSSTSDSKTIVDRILQLQTSETSYQHALRQYIDTAGDDVNHSKEHFKALVRGLDQKYDAIKKVANDLLGIIESSSRDQKLVNALRHVFKKNAKLDWINVLQDDMNGLLKTAEPQQPVVPQDTGTDQPTMFDTEGTEGSNNGTDTGTDQSTMFNNAGTLGGFSSTAWSYVKPVLSAPLRVFNWVRSWFW